MAGQNVVFDAGMLILLLQEGARAPVHPKTKDPISRVADRVAFLKETLVESRSKIVIPTPALAEFLVGAGDVLEDYIDRFDSDSYIEVQPFTQRAAIEAAIATQDALQAESATDKTVELANPRQVVKVDRQIVAIAKVAGVTAIYTTDGDVMKQAEAAGVPACHVAALPLPPDDPQQDLFDSDEEPEAKPEATEIRRSSDGPSEGQVPAEAEGQGKNGEEEAPS